MKSAFIATLHSDRRVRLKAIMLASLTAFAVLGCHHDSPKVERQKAIYSSVSDVPHRELEHEIVRAMETQHLPTPGRAMIYLLDQSIAYLPRVDAMVEQAATKAGVRLPPKDPLEEAEAKIKVAREVQSMLAAREAIARIEAEVE
jgi:hypothetical protein